GSRSPATPAASVTTAAAACRPARTIPTDVAELPEMCRTAKTSAIAATPSPRAEIVVLAKTSRKFRSTSAPRRPVIQSEPSLPLSSRLPKVRVRDEGRASGPGRDRTYDLGIKSPLLYQLS